MSELVTKINDYAHLRRVNGAVYCLETTNDDDEFRDTYIVRVDPPDETCTTSVLKRNGADAGLYTVLLHGHDPKQGFETVDHAVEWALEKLHLADVPK